MLRVKIAVGGVEMGFFRGFRGGGGCAGLRWEGSDHETFRACLAVGQQFPLPVKRWSWRGFERLRLVLFRRLW